MPEAIEPFIYGAMGALGYALGHWLATRAKPDA